VNPAGQAGVLMRGQRIGVMQARHNASFRR